jgi:hypothetical protein
VDVWVQARELDVIMVEPGEQALEARLVRPGDVAIERDLAPATTLTMWRSSLVVEVVVRPIEDVQSIRPTVCSSSAAATRRMSVVSKLAVDAPDRQLFNEFLPRRMGPESKRD